jgi:hypothetical protein
MRRAIAAWVVAMLVGCADPPPPDVTHQAAGHAVLARQYDECVASVRGLRDARNRDEARVRQLESRGADTTEARAAYEADRDAITRREAECSALHDRMRELR